MVNKTLPTRCCALTLRTKAASQAGFRNRAENFFVLMTHRSQAACGRAVDEDELGAAKRKIEPFAAAVWLSRTECRSLTFFWGNPNRLRAIRHSFGPGSAISLDRGASRFVMHLGFMSYLQNFCGTATVLSGFTVTSTAAVDIPADGIKRI